MKHLRFYFSIIALAFLVQSCKDDSNIFDEPTPANELDLQLEEALLNASGGIGLEHFRFPSTLSDIPQDPKNPLTAAKVALGQLLYHETGLATKPKLEQGRFTYSCASCHHVDGGFQACLPQGLGEGGSGFGLHGEGRFPNSNYPVAQLDVQPIRTPSALNIAYQPNILWNGQFGGTHMNIGTEAGWDPNSPKVWNHLGYEGTETQAIAGMKVHRLSMTEELFQSTSYKELFYAAFGQVGDDTLRSDVFVGLAVAAYERTLLATEAPFQKWLNGDRNAMNAKEKRGAILFFGKAECASCHNGPALSSMAFYALGMNKLDGQGVYLTNFTDQTINLGRGGFTNVGEDMYKFKVPQLYNLIQSKFYGHGGNFHSVEEVVRYKNKAIPENPEVPQERLAAGFHPLNLTNAEIEAISAFIEYGLFDRNLSRYVPTSLPSGYCFPNNDPRSAMERGCE